MILLNVCPLSFKVIFSELQIHDRESFRLTSTDLYVVRESLEKHDDMKIKNADQKFVGKFFGVEKHEIYLIIGEIFVRLMLFYFMEHGIDIPLFESFEPEPDCSALLYLHRIRAPINMIAQYFCKENMPKLISQWQKLAEQRNDLSIESDDYASYLSTKISIKKSNIKYLLEIRFNHHRRDDCLSSIDFYFDVSLFSNETKKMKIKEYIFELGKAIEIFKTRKNYEFILKAIGVKTILNIIY